MTQPANGRLEKSGHAAFQLVYLWNWGMVAIKLWDTKSSRLSDHLRTSTSHRPAFGSKSRQWQSRQLSYSVTRDYYWSGDRIYYRLGSKKVANLGCVRPDCTTRHPRATVSLQLAHKNISATHAVKGTSAMLTRSKTTSESFWSF